MRAALGECSLLSPWKVYSSDCNYCRRPRNSGHVCYGLETRRVQAQDYEQLLELGFIRSGSHIYRPENGASCCPNLPNRLDALTFAHSRCHARALRAAAEALSGVRALALPPPCTDPFGASLALARESPERAREAALALARYRAAGESAESAAAAADARALGIVFLDAEEEAERSQPLPRMLR